MFREAKKDCPEGSSAFRTVFFHRYYFSISTAFLPVLPSNQFCFPTSSAFQSVLLSYQFCLPPVVPSYQFCFPPVCPPISDFLPVHISFLQYRPGHRQRSLQTQAPSIQVPHYKEEVWKVRHLKRQSLPAPEPKARWRFR